MAYNLEESSVPSDAAQPKIHSTWYAGAGWIATKSYTLKMVELPLSTYGNAPQLYVQIWSADGSGYPLSLLSSHTVNMGSLPAYPSATFIQFVFDTPVDIVADSSYVIVVLDGGGGDSDNCGRWKIGYGGQGWYTWSNDSGSTWTGPWSQRGWWKTYSELLPPEKPTGPTPAHKATRTAIDTDTIDWIDGGAGQENAAEAYDVYFGLDEDNLVLAAASQAATEFKIDEIENGSPFEYSQFRAWRIDAINVGGTTEGDVWIFSTGFWLSFPPQRLSNYENIEDAIWDIASQAWTNDADYLAVGGGRYKNQIIAVGHGVIYFGEI